MRYPVSGAIRWAAPFMAAALAAIVLGLAVAPAALAHADLVAATPAPGAKLPRSPGQVVLTFTEAVDVSLSAVQVYDQKGAAVPGLEKPQPAAGLPYGIVARLTRTLPTGLYTVEWRAISSDDGHATAGVYSFGVREQPSSAQARGLSGTTPGQQAASIAGRWLLYLGLVVLVGAALTGWAAFGGRVTESGQWLLRGAWLLAAVGLFVSMIAERAITRTPSLLPMFLTPPGAALANEGKALVACGAALVVLFAWPHRAVLGVVSALAAATMLFHVLAGHADAASPRAVAVAAQWLHMLGVGVWVGGLVWLVLGLREQPATERARAVERFSTIATFALGVVLVTGLVRAFGEVAWSRLFVTSYGVTLLVKLELVAALVALGAVNHYRIVPALSHDAGAFGPFRLSTRGELGLAAGVLAATAVLAGLAPAIVP